MDDVKTFIIGDIHGCLGPLKEMMKKIDWRPGRDQLIFLGDYIDRGKERLDFHLPVFQGALEPFIYKPLVGGVLIDKHQAFRRLEKHIAVCSLAQDTVFPGWLRRRRLWWLT